jgi:hypothetical protein
MRDRSNDLGAILVILLGAVAGGRFYASLFPGDRFDVVIERRFDRRFDQRFERRFDQRFDRRFDRGREGRSERRYGREGSAACTAFFRIDSRGPGWTVAGEYEGVARLSAEGLEVELREGSTTAQLEDADVRAVVLGLTWEGAEGRWLITHRAEPIPLGALAHGETRDLGERRLLIPGVGAAELATGWLVVEHVLDAPDSEGGTAWTYAHAERDALSPLLFGCPPS